MKAFSVLVFLKPLHVELKSSSAESDDFDLAKLSWMEFMCFHFISSYVKLCWHQWKCLLVGSSCEWVLSSAFVTLVQSPVGIYLHNALS